MRKLLTMTVVAGSMALAGTAMAGPDARMLSETCYGCHGTDGTSVGPATPTIAGMPVDYFIDSMKMYRDGTRPSTVMQRIAKGYTDEEFKAMGDFFAKKSFGRPDQPFDAAMAKEGKDLAKKYCDSCHEDDGKVGDVGVLAGQKLPYMQYSVADFLSGKREMEKRQAAKFKELQEAKGDAGFAAVLNFYAQVK